MSSHWVASEKERRCLQALWRRRGERIAQDRRGGLLGRIAAWIDRRTTRTPPPPERKNLRAFWWTYGGLLPGREPKLEVILEVARILYGAEAIDRLSPEKMVDEALRLEAELIGRAAVSLANGVEIRPIDASTLLLRELDTRLPPYDSEDLLAVP